MRCQTFPVTLRRLNRLLFAFLLIISCLVVVACNDAPRSTATGNDDRLSTHQQTHKVEHALGEVEVPLNPQRLVTPSPCTMEAELSLGMQPISGSHWNWDLPYLQGKVEGIQDVGWIPDINLESVASLNPDLIVATVAQQPVHHLLSQIAPKFLSRRRLLWNNSQRCWAVSS